MDEEKAIEIADKVIKYNSKEKNILKVIEECMELGEVLVKTLTKQPEDKPPIEKLIEEIGDVYARCYILAHQMGITEKVQERSIHKFNQLDRWMSEKYEGVV